MVFLSQKVDGNMIFTDYWKVLVLTFSEMGNTVFSWAKKLTEIWCLLITGKFLFWTFRWWEIRSFFQPKSWWKDDIYMVFLSFLWYSRTWEIWFFTQWSAKWYFLHWLISDRLNLVQDQNDRSSIVSVAFGTGGKMLDFLDSQGCK